MSPFGCGCALLCDECLGEHVSWYAGVAYNRGEDWARAIANVLPLDRPWPRTAKSREIALRKARRLTSDPRLVELLADRVELGAERWWNKAIEQAG